ncbi:MAG TPA: FAD-dependent oxidoreductase, partial [Accumulibacter sp.]|nr:FAD-dependent oxidoreductase [Accumulibacter sp.]
MNPHAIVIGAGLAGSSAAERLAARGWKIDLIERAHEPGQGASGNIAGVLRPLPSLDDNRLARLTRAGFEHACRHFAALTAAG